MLQQTQVERVIPLFEAFVARFPDFSSLAAASKADVLRLWQGLGYNSRAIRLLALAQRVVHDYAGQLPSDSQALAALPGIGPYTQAAIRAFAFDLPDLALDTNLRRILHRVFFGVEFPPQASSTELEAVAAQMLIAKESNAWNSAMMDLGATICTARAPKCLLCPLRADCVAAPIDAQALQARAREFAPRRGPQSRMRFEDTVRYLRGRVIDRLRALPAAQTISFLDLHADLRPHLGERQPEDVLAVLVALEQEGLIAHDERGIALAE